jgi:peptidoglycan/LPS O-acetylase OafA/YrhL
MVWPATLPAFLVAVLLVAAIVHLSWRCVELPFLRLKPQGCASQSAHILRVVESGAVTG